MICPFLAGGTLNRDRPTGLVNHSSSFLITKIATRGGWSIPRSCSNYLTLKGGKRHIRQVGISLHFVDFFKSHSRIIKLMAKKTTQIYLRRPKDDEIKYVPPSLQVYGMDGQEEDWRTKFAKFWGCTRCNLYLLIILYAIMLATFIILLCLKKFSLDPSLLGMLIWALVLLPLRYLVCAIASSICFYALHECLRVPVEKVDTGDREPCSASCVCKTLLAVVLWLIDWGLGVLGSFLDIVPGSLGEWIGSDLIVHVAVSLISFLIVVGCYMLSRCLGK
jgi:hypothetical protein